MSTGARRNLLVILTDQQRADSVGMVQCGVPVCPELERFAMSGTRFETCYTTCPLCVPSRTALFTGHSTQRNGVLINDHHQPGTTAMPMHRVLAQHGYRLGHIGRNEVRCEPSLDTQVDFDVWVTPGQHRDWLTARGDVVVNGAGLYREILENVQGTLIKRHYSAPASALWPGHWEHYLDIWYADQAVAALARFAAQEQPFALFVNLFAPHPPLLVPEPFASRFPPQLIDLPSNVGKAAAGEPTDRRSGLAAQLAEGVDEATWRRTWSAHLGLTSLADTAIGRILDALRGNSLWDETVVVISSDHGEQLGQHAMYQKMEMYEPAVRVPLLIKVPGFPAGQRIATPVSHLDLMPTVGDVLDVAMPVGDGRSLLPALRTGSLDAQPIVATYDGNAGIGDRRRMVVAEHWKLIHAPDAHAGDELYDLQLDPLEMQNRIADPSQNARIQSLCALLKRQTSG